MTLNNLRTAALIEGTTLVLLMLIAVPLKHMADIPQFVSLIGPMHGIAFLGYLFVLFKYSSKDKPLSASQITVGILAALIPFGSFIFERKVLKTL
ncbi:MAG: DUF3817 domain-containing protein [Thiotrichaceae bacterium]|nr:DUF3817 domain-containing protein [Thiotrichaceae bacterium]